MSVAKITHVKKAMKPQGVCSAHGCDVEIAKGDPYLWWKVGFRSHYKHIRCVDHPPRPSERESSMISSVLAAIEDLEDSVDGCETVEDVQALVEAVVEAMREVAGEYATASEDQNGTVWNTEAAERAEMLEASADELDGWDPSESEPDGCEDHDENEDDCDDCTEMREEWISGVRSEAVDAVNNAELP